MSNDRRRTKREARDQARQAGREIGDAARRMADDVREDARRLEQEAREAGRKIEHEAREAGRQIERDAREAGQEIEREAREAAVGPIWGRPEPGVRRAAHTREDIARTALAIADAEGIDAVSMRRVARELGAGTMTLYHYVRNKDELIELMDDAMMSELIVPDDEMPSDWREALTAIARRSHAAWARHPWAKDAPPGASIGPNALRHFEQSLAAVAGLGLDATGQFEIIALVDEWVLGFALRDTYLSPDGTTSIASEWTGSVADYIDAQVATGDFPHMHEMIGDRGTRAAVDDIVEMMQGEDRFERGLAILLDGIALDLERRRGAK